MNTTYTCKTTTNVFTTKFEQTFNEIFDIIRQDERCRCEIDYVEQLSWVLCLKYLEDFENDRKAEAELSGKAYNEIIRHEYKWETWTAPKDKNGKIDYHKLDNQVFQYDNW